MLRNAPPAGDRLIRRVVAQRVEADTVAVEFERLANAQAASCTCRAARVLTRVPVDVDPGRCCSGC